MSIYVTTLFPRPSPPAFFFRSPLFSLPLYYANREPGTGYSLFNLHVVNTTLIVHSFFHLANKFENFVTRKTAVRWVIPEHTVKSVKKPTGNFLIRNWSSECQIPEGTSPCFHKTTTRSFFFLLVRAWSSN